MPNRYYKKSFKYEAPIGRVDFLNHLLYPKVVLGGAWNMMNMRDL